jgi:hypothetical protein
MLIFQLSETPRESDGQNTEILVTNVKNYCSIHQTINIMRTIMNTPKTPGNESHYFGNLKRTKRVQWSAHRHYGL